MTRPAAVRLRDLSLGFDGPGGTRFVFRKARLEIRPGDLVCLLGPSGSGKSVLLNLLIGALRHGEKGVVIDGERALLGTDIASGVPAELSRRLGIVFQEGALFEDLSVRQNAAFALRGRALSGSEINTKIDALLEAVDLADPPRRVHELSGGQRKRLALARTLAQEPELIIYDEPTSGLDPVLCRQIAALIKSTHDAAHGTRTTLVVTHDYDAVVPIATRTLLLNPSEGTIDEVERGHDPGTALAEISSAPPLVVPPKPGRALLARVNGAVKTPYEWIEPTIRFMANPLPASGKQLLLRLADSFVLPALYVCAAGAVLGGLATFFSLENNPLKGAMDRQALIGLGKVLMAIVVPLMTAVLFAARVGAGAAARLGNIRLGRQDDALRMLGANPTAYLVTPLFWSCLVGLPLVTLPVCAAAALTSLACACAARPITPFGWASSFFDEVTLSDINYVLIKLIGSGALVAATAAFLGLKPKSGAEDLGRDVTGTIVVATFLVILWHGVLTYFQYGV